MLYFLPFPLCISIDPLGFEGLQFLSNCLICAINYLSVCIVVVVDFISSLYSLDIFICLLLFLVIRTELCRFSGAKIYPGKGIRFIRSDSQVG